MSQVERRIVVAAALVWSGDRVVVQRRAPTAAHGAGRLELPGGKVELGESPAAAMRRELVEEWGEAARELPIGPVAEVLHHDYPAPGPEVILIVFHVDADAWSDAAAAGTLCDRVETEAGVELESPLASQLEPERFLEADGPFVERVRDGAVGRPRFGAAGRGAG